MTVSNKKKDGQQAHADSEAASADSRPVPGNFASFSWKDLDEWTDDGSIRRGKGYVSNVSDVAITKNGHVIATVSGTDDYATEVWFDGGELEGRCSCPVGHRCKHTVALVLKCIDILAAGGSLPLADEDDDRLEELNEDGVWDGDDDFDDDFIDDGDEEIADAEGYGRGCGRNRSVTAKPRSPKSGDELDAFIDGLDETSAKQMIREIMAQRGDIRADWLRRVKTERGDVAQLLKMARKELKRLSREEAWVNPWKHEYHIPDYLPLRRILEKLLAAKAFDELVAFGDSLKAETLPQIQSAHDEGDTACEICSCMEIVAKAVRHGSMSAIERMRWFHGLHEDDEYATFDGAYDPFDHPGDWETSDWSAFADELRESAAAAEGKGDSEDEYDARQRMGRVCAALQNAERADEAKSYHTDWLRRHGQFADLAKFLLENGETDAAWDTAIEGFTSKNARDEYGRLREELRGILREIALKRGDARLALSIQAEDFFANPSEEAFFPLLEAAKSEGIDDAVRQWLVRFLETGKSPSAKSASWPLAPSGIPLRDSARHAEPGDEILLRIALKEKDPDETLRRWKKFKSANDSQKFNAIWTPAAYLVGKVADALAEAYPDESLDIWDKIIAGKLSFASASNYDDIAQTFRKSRPVMKRLGRLEEWKGRIRSIQTEYKRRTNLVKALDALFEPMSASPRPIISTRHPNGH